MKKIIEIDLRLVVAVEETDDFPEQTISNHLDLPNKVLSTNIIDTEIFDDGIDMNRMIKERYDK